MTTLLGIILLFFSVGFLSLAVWRFDWLQRYVPFLLYWGRWPWRYRASRFGFIAGNLVGVPIGCLCLDSKFEFLGRGTWLVILVVSFCIALAGAIYDYILYKRRSA